MENTMKSLANTEKFPAGVGVAVNREMLCWFDNDKFPHKEFITAWDGNSFIGKSGFSMHACEVPELSENEFVCDGVRYVANFDDSSCVRCHAQLKDRKTYDCKNINGVSCHPQERKDGRGCNWKRADKTLGERVEAIEKRIFNGGAK